MTYATIKSGLIAATLLGLGAMSGAAQAVMLTGTCPMGHDMTMNQMHMDMSPAARKLVEYECSSCHGADGNGVKSNDDVPNLAGQEFMYLCAWLQQCREKGKQCASHEDLASRFTDHDIIGFAMYYTHLPSNKW